MVGVVLAVAIVAAIGAVAFRLRGSSFIHELLPWLPMAGRIVWSLAMTAAALWLYPVWEMLLLAPAFFLGCIPGWKSSIDLGRNEGDRARDAAVMAVRGVGWTLPAGVVLWFFGPPGSWWFGLAGVVCPACYEIAWRVPSRLPFLHRGPELGEFLFGGAIGAALALAI